MFFIELPISLLVRRFSSEPTPNERNLSLPVSAVKHFMRGWVTDRHLVLHSPEVGL